MGERLSHGARIHNRREKAAVRRGEKRTPNLIWPVSRVIEHPSETPQLSPFIPTTYREPATPIINANEPTIRKMPSVVSRNKPTFEEIVTAGSTLSMTYHGLNSDDEKNEYLSDREAVGVLEELTIGIHSGKILSHKEIAQQVRRLGHKMGPMGSVSTDIDVAAWNVLDAIKANKSRLTSD